MPTLPELFPGFETRFFETDGARIHARIGGNGPPLVLIHGFPQTGAEWHRIAPALAKHFTLIIPDLRGYGLSSAPKGDAKLYAKRVMGADILALLDQLNYREPVRIVGHDRGARVTYRLALDHPNRVQRIALIDIAPTLCMWEGMNATSAMKVYHWMFLAQPYPLPEKLIAADPGFYVEHTIASWTGSRSLKPYDGRAMDHYRANLLRADYTHAACQDYRAGQTHDLDHDRAARDAGQTIQCPTYILWGNAGIPAAGGPLKQWRETFAPQAEGSALDCGHFTPEEDPDGTLAALLPFLTR
ncbi:alpha/beta hydrolase [Rhizobiales bacterium TNE-4]|nr:alpha/beta hydrolase [Rhizobiales bacterium TNE-4]MBV1826298.1 alpha/beta hydrolase [Rhizobiales bacterium TNE-4]